VNDTELTTFEGGCACGAVRYRMHGRPMFVHCCHCRWCQRESGSAFALNAMIETDRIELLGEVPARVPTPSLSGTGQLYRRCPHCHVALWSHYGGSSEAIAFLRVGTLREPDAFPPDVHIFTSSKQPWVVLPEVVPAFDEFYQRSKLWPADRLDRRRAALASEA
jgi:hypothetical protein